MFISNSKFYVKSTITSTQAATTTFLISEDLETGVDIETGAENVSIVLKTNTQIERMTITATGGTATIVARGLTQADTKVGSVPLQKQWIDGTLGYITALASDLLDLDGPNVITGDNIYSGVQTFQEAIITEKGVASTVYATTAARDAALGGDGVATLAYTGIQANGVFYNYNLSTNQWESIDTGTTTPNASDAATGKVRLADSAQSIAGTDTEAGDPLVVIPSDIAKNIQSGTFVYAGASATGTDAYSVTTTPVLPSLTVGMKIIFKADVANTGACSIDFNDTAVTGAINIKTKLGNDPSDGDIGVDEFITVLYDGTNAILQKEVKDYSIFGTGVDGEISGALTITGSNGTIIEKNYTNFAPGSNTVTITPTNCIVVLRITGDCNLTNTTFNFNGKGGQGGAGSGGGTNNGNIGETGLGLRTPLGGAISDYNASGNSGAGGGGAGTKGHGNPITYNYGVSPMIDLSYFQAGYSDITVLSCGAGGGSSGTCKGGTGSLAGGHGGGCVILLVKGNLTYSTTALNFQGTIGGAGQNNVPNTSSTGGSGGGGGGSFLGLHQGTLTGSPTINVAGGAGGAGGTYGSSAGGAGGAGTYASKQITITH